MTSAAKGASRTRPDPTNVAAVIVTYHPDQDLAARVRKLVGQVAQILIIDNGSTDAELAPIQELIAEGTAHSILNGRNIGLAAALNRGLAWGEEQGFTWVATLDQDSTPRPNLVSEAAGVCDAHPQRPIAVIGAGWVNGLGREAACPTPGGIEVTHVITSGALHRVGAWRALGGFRSDFFIDYVDIEFCLRARAAGYLVVQACHPTISHAIGNPTSRRLLFRPVTLSNHDRSRRYSITRNRVLVWRTYWHHEARFVAADFLAATKELVKLAAFEDDRVAKLRAVGAGIRDGLRMPRRRP